MSNYFSVKVLSEEEMGKLLDKKFLGSYFRKKNWASDLAVYISENQECFISKPYKDINISGYICGELLDVVHWKDIEIVEEFEKLPCKCFLLNLVDPDNFSSKDAQLFYIENVLGQIRQMASI